MSDRENIIISTGRLDPIKGYKELIEAFKIVHSELPSWKLKIIGDGNQRVELERLLQVFNLQDAVSLAGLEPKVQRELEKAKFLFQVLEETMSIIEALAAGLAIVSTRTSGGTHLLKNGEYGCLVTQKCT